MKNTALLSALAVIAVSHYLPAFGAVTTIGSPVYNPATQHNYYLLSYGSWTDSEAYAQTLGGHLATVNDAAENSWILNTFSSLTGIGTLSYFWIGLSNPSMDLLGGSHTSNFVWADGSPVSYTYWYGSEPNNTGGVEFYTALRSLSEAPPTGSWNDLPNSGGGWGQAGYLFGVAEVPEPGVGALAGLGMAVSLVLGRNRKQ